MEYQRKIGKVHDSDFINPILKTCPKRDDVQGRVVQQHMINIDLVAVRARYHEDCRKKFFTSFPATHSSVGRPVSPEIDEAMEKINQTFEDSDDCQFSVEELRSSFSGHVPHSKTIKE